MIELTRFQMAAVKRTEQSVRALRRKKVRLEATIEKTLKEIEELDQEIDIWEQPVIQMTGGFTSEQVLNGEMELAEELKDNNDVNIDEVDDSNLEEYTVEPTPVDNDLHILKPTPVESYDPMPFD